MLSVWKSRRADSSPSRSARRIGGYASPHPLGLTKSGTGSRIAVQRCRWSRRARSWNGGAAANPGLSATRRRGLEPPGAVCRTAQPQVLEDPYRSGPGIHDYIELFHDARCRHSALGMLTPTEYEDRCFATHDAA